jgi:hypothetical protein
MKEKRKDFLQIGKRTGLYFDELKPQGVDVFFIFYDRTMI